jgi:quercetin dioxygenase-like cupin family protein
VADDLRELRRRPQQERASLNCVDQFVSAILKALHAVPLDRPQQRGLFTMHVIVPAGWSHPPLSHPVAEHLAVLSGTIYIGKRKKFDAGAMKTLPAGSFMVIPPNTPRFAMAKEESDSPNPRHRAVGIDVHQPRRRSQQEIET